MAKEFGDKLENLDLTNDEVKRLAECMKDKKFMELLKDYADEISNPVNKKKYEEEIAMMERERGNNVKFINPTPCYVLKSSCNGKEKCFVNICTSKEVGEPACKPSVKDSSKGMQWTIPHSLSQPREDVDKSNSKCMVYDVIFNPDTCHMAQKNARFRKMIEDIALDAIERNFDTKLDKVNVKKPKMKYKGSPQASIIRTPSGDGKPLVQDPKDPLAFPYPAMGDNTKVSETSKVKPKDSSNSASFSVKESTKVDEFVEPKYTFVHRGYFDIKKYYAMSDQTVASTRPRELILNVELPMLKSAAPLELEISENRVFLECTKPVKYRLDLKLPYPIDDTKGNAKFEKNKKRLVITMEVIPPVIQNYTNGLNKDECCDAEDSEFTNNQFAEEHSAESLLPNSLIEDRAECRYENCGLMWKKPYSDDDPTEECDPLVLNSPALIESLSQAGKDGDQDFEKIRPQMQYHQTDDFVVIIIKIKSIDCDRLWYNISPSELQFSAMTMDNKMQIHQLYLRFEGSDKVEPQRSKVNVSGDNAVFTLRKHRQSLCEWQYFKAGFDADSVIAKYFLTGDNIENLMSDTRKEAEGNVKMQLECEVLLESQHPNLLALKLTPKSGRADIDSAESNLKDVATVLDILDKMDDAQSQILPESSTKNTGETPKNASKSEENTENSNLVVETKPSIQNDNDTDEDDDSSDCGDSSSETNVEIPKITGDQQNASDTVKRYDEISKTVGYPENKNHVSLTGQAEQLNSECNEGGAKAAMGITDKEQRVSRDEVLVVREHDKESNTKTEVCIDHKTKSIIKLSNEMLFDIDSD